MTSANDTTEQHFQFPYHYILQVLLKGLLCIVLVSIPLITIIGNILVIWAVLTQRRLQQVQNYLLVSLAVADLSVAVLVMPISISLELTGKWYFGHIVCDIWRTLDVMGSTASILHLCGIAVDRYYAITKPVLYANYRTRSMMMIYLAVVWIASLFISLPPVTIWQGEGHGAAGEGCELINDRVYILYSATGSFYAPLFVMLILYFKIYQVARAKQREKARRLATKTDNKNADANYGKSYSILLPLVSETNKVIDATLIQEETSISEEEITKDLSIEHSRESPCTPIRGNKKRPVMYLTTNTCKPNTASIPTKIGTEQKRRKRSSVVTRINFSKERKAARTLGIILGLFIFCWLPFFVLYAARGIAQFTPSYWLFALFTWLGYVNSLCNPIIYTIFNQDFRAAFKKVLWAPCLTKTQS